MPATRLDHVRGLEDYWRRGTFRAPPRPEDGIADQLLLSVLGLGLEQTLQHLGRDRPGFAEFQDWILATAGPPDGDTVARFHATLDSAPPPGSTADRLAMVDGMPSVLAPAEQERFARDGYAIVEGAISRSETEQAAEAVLTETGADLSDPGTWYGARTNGIMVQLFQHPALEVARRSARVHKAFAELWGRSDLWMITDRASFSPPLRPGEDFAPPRLHWDASLVPPIPFATQGILYLVDTDEDQGALELVPGFHHRIDAWLDSLGDADPRGVDLSADSIRVAAPAGALIIWRQDLPHGASPNRTDRPRVAQYVNMFPADLRQQQGWR
jgi:hypothetical protein